MPLYGTGNPLTLKWLYTRACLRRRCSQKWRSIYPAVSQPAIITGVSSPCKTWGIICSRAKTLRVLDACYLLGAWLRVRLLMDCVGDPDSRLAHLPAPPQSEYLSRTRFLLLKKVLPALALTLMSAVPDPVSSSQPYNLPLPPSPAKKLRTALQ